LTNPQGVETLYQGFHAGTEEECRARGGVAGGTAVYTSGASYSTLGECSYTTHHNCAASEGIWLQCDSLPTCQVPAVAPAPSTVVQRVQLLDPHSLQPDGYANQGILQAQVGGRWGYVCDDYFDMDNNAATVACKQLGRGYTSGVHCDARITCPRGLGTCEFTLDDVQCDSDTYHSLSQCSAVGMSGHDCGSSEGILLVCADSGQTAQCPPPPDLQGLRLRGGRRGSGLLQATVDGTTWGPVCDDYFDRDDKQVEVVCRELGFLNANGGQQSGGRNSHCIGPACPSQGSGR